jgi:hypothetical protein
MKRACARGSERIMKRTRMLHTSGGTDPSRAESPAEPAIAIGSSSDKSRCSLISMYWNPREIPSCSSRGVRTVSTLADAVADVVDVEKPLSSSPSFPRLSPPTSRSCSCLVFAWPWNSSAPCMRVHVRHIHFNNPGNTIRRPKVLLHEFSLPSPGFEQ